MRLESKIEPNREQICGENCSAYNYVTNESVALIPFDQLLKDIAKVAILQLAQSRWPDPRILLHMFSQLDTDQI